MSSSAMGGCACGAVTYTVDGELRDVINCHCEPCRRITGHFMAATSAAFTAVTIDEQGELRWYDRTAEVKYGFCFSCGSTLFWRAATSPDRISIAAGSLDPPTRLRTSLALFGNDASDYHTLDRSIETLPRDSSPSCADG